MTDPKPAKSVNLGGATYSGYSVAGPLNGSGDVTQRIRQDVFAAFEASDFFAQNFTFIQFDSQDYEKQSMYSETNLWLGHKASPVGLAGQWVFSSNGPTQGFVGPNIRLTDIPGLRSACEVVGLTAYAQPMVGFDYSTGKFVKEIYTEYFYTLDPMKKGIRPRLSGFVDHHASFENEHTVNTEHRLEAIFPLTDRFSASVALEARRYGFLPGAEIDKWSLAGIGSLNISAF